MSLLISEIYYNIIIFFNLNIKTNELCLQKWYKSAQKNIFSWNVSIGSSVLPISLSFTEYYKWRIPKFSNKSEPIFLWINHWNCIVNMEITRATLGIAVGIAGTLFLGYCVYFDQQRRKDPLFKKKLRDRKYFIIFNKLALAFRVPMVNIC